MILLAYLSIHSLTSSVLTNTFTLPKKYLDHHPHDHPRSGLLLVASHPLTATSRLSRILHLTPLTSRFPRPHSPALPYPLHAPSSLPISFRLLLSLVLATHRTSANLAAPARHHQHDASGPLRCLPPPWLRQHLWHHRRGGPSPSQQGSGPPHRRSQEVPILAGVRSERNVQAGTGSSVCRSHAQGRLRTTSDRAGRSRTRPTCWQGTQTDHQEDPLRSPQGVGGNEHQSMEPVFIDQHSTQDSSHSTTPTGLWLAWNN